MIVRTQGGNREARGILPIGRADFTGSDRIPLNSETGVSHSGQRVLVGDAVGLPAVLRAIRILAETTALMQLQTVEAGALRPIPKLDAPQWPMLAHWPNERQSAFDVWSFAIVCLLRGGLVLQKLKTNRGELVGLEPIAPDRYGGRPVWKDGELIVKVREGKKTVELRHEQMLYIPGILLDDPYIGVSIIEAQRQALGNPLARQRFEGRFLANDASTPIVLKHEGPNSPDEPTRKSVRESFEQRHRGQPGRPALMWGGWSLEKLGLTLEDAQFIESQKFTVQEVGRMFGVPAGKLGDPDAPGQKDPVRENLDLLQYGLMPWHARLEQGLYRDDDVFPDKTVKPRFFTDELLRADQKTRYEAYLKARQAGWRTANEIRADEGIEPDPRGNELQATPVGGAPNTEPAPPPED